MWIQHLFSLLGTAASSFIEAIGTTGLGLGLGLAFAVLTGGTTLYRVFRSHGWDAMLSHWEDDLKIAARVSIICALCIYLPVAAWKLGCIDIFLEV